MEYLAEVNRKSFAEAKTNSESRFEPFARPIYGVCQWNWNGFASTSIAPRPTTSDKPRASFIVPFKLLRLIIPPFRSKFRWSGNCHRFLSMIDWMRRDGKRPPRMEIPPTPRTFILSRPINRIYRATATTASLNRIYRNPSASRSNRFSVDQSATFITYLACFRYRCNN